MVAWVVGCAWATAAVRDLLLAAAAQVQRAVDLTTQVGGSVEQAGRAAGRVPVVGGELGRPLTDASDSVAQLATSAQQQVDLLRQMAELSIVVLFILPVAFVVWRWLPGRIRFVRERRSAARLIDADADLSLFALRAMAHQPMTRLAAISDDPVGAWRTDNAPVVRRLAALELRESGLPLPPEAAPGAARTTPTPTPAAPTPQADPRPPTTPPTDPTDNVG